MDVPHVLLYVRVSRINKLSQPLLKKWMPLAEGSSRGAVTVSDTSSSIISILLQYLTRGLPRSSSTWKVGMKMNEKAIQDTVEKGSNVTGKDRLNRELERRISTEKTTLLK